jgi:hypothetical protein
MDVDRVVGSQMLHVFILSGCVYLSENMEVKGWQGMTDGDHVDVSERFASDVRLHSPS